MTHSRSTARRRWLHVALVAAAGLGVGLLMVATVVEASGEGTAEEAAAPPAPTVVVNARSAGLRRYPCSECHAQIELRTPTTPPRTPHNRMTFKHMPGIEMCVQCHVRDDMDSLQLFTEEKVSFDESDRICGQCHPEKHADWQMGIHGKTVGSWQRVRIRYTCADCHPPHQPAYQHTVTLPPPRFPVFGIRKH